MRRNDSLSYLAGVLIAALGLAGCGQDEVPVSEAEKGQVPVAEAAEPLKTVTADEANEPPAGTPVAGPAEIAFSDDAELIEAEVIILQASEPPDPETAPYKDCLIHLLAKEISRNSLPVDDGRTLNLVVYAFKDRKWERSVLIQKGVRLNIVAQDFFTTPQTLQTLQRVDETGDFISPVMWVRDWTLREGALDAFPEPPDEDLVPRQLALIKKILPLYDDLVIGGVKNGWFFDLKSTDHYKPDFWKGYENQNPNIQGSFKAITTFHEQLRKRGIQLHVIVAPRSASIYPDIATNVRYDPRTHGRVNTEVEEMVKELLARGVSVIDLTPDFLEKRWYKFGDDHYPLFLPNDHHWSPLGVRLAAKSIAVYLVENGFVELPEKELNLIERKQLLSFAGQPYNEWIFPSVPDLQTSFDTPYFTLVAKDDEAAQALEPDQEAPIQILGDSFTFCHKTGNNLRSRLVDELRQPLAFFAVAGGAMTETRIHWAHNADLSKAKQVLWVVGENELGQEDQWHYVPLDAEESVDLLSPAVLETLPEKDVRIREAGGKLEARFGEQLLPAGEKEMISVVSQPLELSRGSFFNCDLFLEPAESEFSDIDMEVDFRLKVGDQIAASRHEIMAAMKWLRFWRVDLSEFGGRTAPVTLEVEIATGKIPQSARPVVKGPVVEGARVKPAGGQ